MREAMRGFERYICTLENSPQRFFVFIESSILPDQKLRVVAHDDAFLLGVLSSLVHAKFTIRVGGRAGAANTPVYNTECFTKFPFPDASDVQKSIIRDLAERLDAHRKRVLADHPHLTLTGLYNVLERLRAGVAPDALDAKERRIFDDGLVLILKELHDAIDVAVAEAYGWPADLSDEDILARLVALNKERAAEEARGHVRWLRPDYQLAKFGTPAQKAEQLEATLVAAEAASAKPAYPADDMAQTAMVMAALANANAPLDAAALASGFRQGRRVEPKVAAVLVALSRMGVVSSAGGRYALKRAA